MKCDDRSVCRPNLPDQCSNRHQEYKDQPSSVYTGSFGTFQKLALLDELCIHHFLGCTLRVAVKEFRLLGKHIQFHDLVSTHMSYI